MEKIIVFIFCVIVIVRMILILIEKRKKNELIKKNHKQIHYIKKKQKELPLYMLLTKIQLWGLLIIPICSFLFSNMYDKVEAVSAASGLYFLLLIFTAAIKENLLHGDQFSYDLAEHNLSFNSEKKEFYTDSIIGTPITFSCKITEGKTTFQDGRVVRVDPSYATYYYTLLLNYDYTEFVELCDDVAFLNNLAVNNKKDFINFTDIQCNSHTLSITIQSKAYAELSDGTFATKLFFQAYENADELVQLIFKESKTKGFY